MNFVNGSMAFLLVILCQSSRAATSHIFAIPQQNHGFMVQDRQASFLANDTSLAYYLSLSIAGILLIPVAVFYLFREPVAAFRRRNDKGYNGDYFKYSNGHSRYGNFSYV